MEMAIINKKVGRTAGGLYAGATAGNGIGASSSLGGSINGENGGAGGLQAESHAFGVSKSVVKLADLPVAAAPAAPVQVPQQNVVPAVEAQPQLDTRTGNEIVVTKTVTKKKYVPEVAKTPVIVQEVPVQAAAPVQAVHQPAPAVNYQPFDYRKFFDFSFFANSAGAFGGSPFGYSGQQQQQQQLPVQQQTPAQDHSISYTVQKQFAPVQYSPVEVNSRIAIEQQPPQPVVAAESTGLSGVAHTGFQKTIKKREITFLNLGSPESAESLESKERKRLGLPDLSIESAESVEQKRLGLKAVSLESAESAERKRLGLPDLSLESAESAEQKRLGLKAVSLESAESAERKRLGLPDLSLENAESAEQKHLGLKAVSLESAESAERKRLGLPDLSLESAESAEQKRLGLKAVSLESAESAERKRLGLPDLSIESIESIERDGLESIESLESLERKKNLNLLVLKKKNIAATKKAFVVVNSIKVPEKPLLQKKLVLVEKPISVVDQHRE